MQASVIISILFHTKKQSLLHESQFFFALVVFHHLGYPSSLPFSEPAFHHQLSKYTSRLSLNSSVSKFSFLKTSSALMVQEYPHREDSFSELSLELQQVKCFLGSFRWIAHRSLHSSHPE